MIKEIEVVAAVCDLCYTLGPCVEKAAYQGELGAPEKDVAEKLKASTWRTSATGKIVCDRCAKSLV